MRFVLANGNLITVILVSFCAIFVASFSTGNRTLEYTTQPAFRSPGDLRLTLLVNECSNSSALRNTIILTSSWICDRFNNFTLFGDLKIGADIYNVCDTKELIDPIVRVAKNDDFNLGIITWKTLPSKSRALLSVLELPFTEVNKHWRSLVTASVGFLSALNWHENVTIITDIPDVLTLFYHESRKQWICVKYVKSFRDRVVIDFSNPTIIFGSGREILHLLTEVSYSANNKLVVVPLDGLQIEALPNGSYLFQPVYAEPQQKLWKNRKLIPSPILLNVAVPLINIARNISNILENTCYNKSHDTCLNRYLKQIKNRYISDMTNLEILQFLKIAPLADKFVYNIFKVEHLALIKQTNHSTRFDEDPVLQSFVKIGTYSIFNYSLNLDGLFLEEEGFNETVVSTLSTVPLNVVSNNLSVPNNCFLSHHVCIFECMNFKAIYTSDSDNDYLIYNVVLRQDPWILAVLSIACLGVVFCVAILIFIFVRIFKKDIFEGNPVLSVLILLTLTIMYASVVPFALEVTFETEFRSILSNYLCLTRSLAVSLSYSCAFSLMLSRCVMLATVAYEAGFMSHITGHVQSLLCLFMIAVQGALSLQSVENCQDLFAHNSFLYTLSYDFLLLGLLFCSCPFIYRSQRNYKEGRYFAISIVLIVLVWITWLTAFVLVEDRWKMAIVCCGLLGTASSILGAVFIPRTYLMTSAVVRDSLTSALPSLAFASSTSVLDLNYSNAQHVYDCVNIATINATVTQHHPGGPQCNPNYYSEDPALETTEIHANSPPTCESPDKVTRF